MKHRLLLTVAASAFISSTALAAGATAETAAIAEAANASGAADSSTTVVVPTLRAGMPVTSTVVTPAEPTVVVAGTSAVALSPVGASLAAHVTDPDTSKFRDALARAPIPASFNPQKGYTIFAVVNGAFDDDENPLFYVVNDSVTVNSMAGASARYDTLSGQRIRMNRMGSSYYVDDKRVNDVNGAPNGVVYTIGGSVAANLGNSMKPGS
jgi:uncharacterized surface protein with fasciclin (FAS1) repeats